MLCLAKTYAAVAIVSTVLFLTASDVQAQVSLRAGAPPDTTPCIAAYERAQTLRKEAKLLDARDSLIVCLSDMCPTSLHKVCNEWLDEVERSTPSVVLTALGPDGRDVVDVKVQLDGLALMDHLDGRAIALDPGLHQFRFTHGGRTVVRRVLIRQGEKDRPIAASFRVQSSKAEPHRPTPTMVYVLGGIGVVGLASFGYFGLNGRSDALALEDCRPRCSARSVDEARRQLIIADVSLAVGLVGLGAASYLYATRTEVKPDPEMTLGIALRLTTKGAMTTVAGSF